MYGYLALDVKAYGWLNPYFSKSVDGDTDKGHYNIMSESTLNAMSVDIEWADVDSIWQE